MYFDGRKRKNTGSSTKPTGNRLLSPAMKGSVSSGMFSPEIPLSLSRRGTNNFYRDINSSMIEYASPNFSHLSHSASMGNLGNSQASDFQRVFPRASTSEVESDNLSLSIDHNKIQSSDTYIPSKTLTMDENGKFILRDRSSSI